MRIVSLVPSWTETLIEAGVNVVGRTRYCIHPEATVKSIPVVGGTKDINWNRVGELKPDLLLLDKEENPKKIAEASPFPFVATHVTDLHSVSRELEMLAEQFANRTLNEWAVRWRQIEARKFNRPLYDTPGILEWWRKPAQPIEQILYVIWKNPFMAVSRETFIGSVLSALGLEGLLPTQTKKYFEFELKNYDPQSTLLLLSTEPYPFAREREYVESLGFPCALIDGEKMSWFGVRTLRFLESIK